MLLYILLAIFTKVKNFTHYSYLIPACSCSLGRVSSSGGGGGEASPSKHPASPPKRKRERRKEEKEREREVHGGEGECVYFCVPLQVISIVSYFMTQLFKSTR